jgi:hypothetical protein
MAKEKAKKGKKKNDSFIASDSEDDRKPKKKKKREREQRDHLLARKLTLCSGASLPDSVVPCYPRRGAEHSQPKNK